MPINRVRLSSVPRLPFRAFLNPFPHDTLTLLCGETIPMFVPLRSVLMAAVGADTQTIAISSCGNLAPLAGLDGLLQRLQFLLLPRTPSVKSWPICFCYISVPVALADIVLPSYAVAEVLGPNAASFIFSSSLLLLLSFDLTGPMLSFHH